MVRTRTVGLGTAARALALACVGWIALSGCAPPTANPWARSSEVERLRAARELRDAGRFAEALAVLDAEGGSEWVPDHVAAIRADLLRAEGDTTGALLAYEQALALAPPSELRARLLRQVAELELERGEVGSAYASTRLAWEASRDPAQSSDGAFRFAEELEKRGFPGEAMLLYRTVWERWPGSNESAPAFTRSSTLGQRLGADRPEPNSLLETGETLRSLFRCTQALEFFAAVLERDALDADARRRAERGRADCAFQQRHYEEAVTQYRALASADPEDLEVRVMAARALGRTGDAKGAVRDLEAAARRAPIEEKPRIQNLISIFVSDDDTEKEQRLLRQIADQDQNADLAREARWRLAWLDIEVRKFQSALRWLEPLTQGSKWEQDVQRARYWSAVARSNLDAGRGDEELRAMAQELPLTYYGMLAAQRLGMDTRGERSFLAPRTGAAQAHEARRALLLIEAGWTDLARYELLSWLRGGSLSREERVTAAGLLHRVGDHSAAVQLVVDGFGGTLDEGVDPLWREAWQAAWPEPFDALVRSAAAEFDFDPALVYAIMREESLYRPEVESAAGARGLMQLIPPTARRIARLLAVDDFTPESLYEPKTNVRLGTYYLKELLQQFDGSRAHAVAAYNAGPDVVKRWMARAGAVPDDQFVDSVPYGETRRYVRRVLRSYRVYQLLYAGNAGAADPGSKPQAKSDRP